MNETPHARAQKLFAQSLAMTRLDLRFRSRLEEQFDSLVTEAFDHSYSV